MAPLQDFRIRRFQKYETGNQWYEQARQLATVRLISDEVAILLMTAPYFLATKIDASRSRGGGDSIASHDMEDIISQLDGRPGILRPNAAGLIQLITILTASNLTK